MESLGSTRRYRRILAATLLALSGCSYDLPNWTNYAIGLDCPKSSELTVIAEPQNDHTLSAVCHNRPGSTPISPTGIEPLKFESSKKYTPFEYILYVTVADSSNPPAKLDGTSFSVKEGADGIELVFPKRISAFVATQT